jgi:cytosine/adenosine deaminase-related metal-dependent hydrolase
MSTLLLKDADLILTMDAQQPRVQHGSLLLRDQWIERLGPASTFDPAIEQAADQVIDARGLVLLPGLVNTHHHFYQTLTRAVPGAQDQELFDWLLRLYPIWGELTDEAIYISSLTAMAELILSGCTTSSDHLYLYPNDATLDAQVRAAQQIGLRFHVTRGAMSLGRSQGGLPPDHVVQREDAILHDCQRVIDAYHDPQPGSMLRVGLAPCSPFSVTGDLMRETARLARAHRGVRLHTHVAETRDEERFCLQQVGLRPAAYMESLGWLGPDVWWAHAIFLNDAEIQQLAATGTGVAHCPASNMRLGSGICRVRDMLDAGVKVGLGVDGSASNDASHLFNEARTALLLQRVSAGAGRFSVVEGLQLATSGGAAVLGRDEIGTLAAGKAADIIGVSLHSLGMAGAAVHDPLAALLLCLIDRVQLSLINGRVVVRDGTLQTLDLGWLIEQHNTLARALVARHPAPPTQ